MLLLLPSITLQPQGRLQNFEVGLLRMSSANSFLKYIDYLRREALKSQEHIPSKTLEVVKSTINIEIII